MRSAAEITGEASVTADIIEFLRTGDPLRCALVGPSGSGKTSAAAQVITGLQDDFDATIWGGNPLTATSPESVLASSQSKGSDGRIKGAAIDFAEDFGNLLLEGHIPFSKTIRNIIGWSAKSAKQRSLTAARQNFLYSIAASGKKHKAPLVVCDDLHNWDEQSLIFLVQVASGFWNDVYPALGKARFLLIWTPEQARPGFMALIKRRFGHDLSIYKLTHVAKTEFRELLIALGARSDLSSDVYDSVFAVSQGHLAFAAQAAALLTGDSKESVPTSWQELEQSLFDILRSRLENLPEMSEAVTLITEAISVIGEALRIDDLICLFKDTDLRLQRALQRAAELGLIHETHQLVRISHEVIQTVVAKNIAADRKRWHARFAECLRELRPASYDRRAIHHLQSGQFEVADTMRAHALLAKVRQGTVIPGDGWALTAGVRNGTVSVFLDQLESAAQKEADRAYADAIATLHAASPPRYPIEDISTLAAERDVLLARLYLMLRDDHSRAFALELCEQWETLAIESELWARIMETRLVILSHLRRHEEGRDIERQLLLKYRDRKKFDPDAAFAEARLKRKAESIHSPRIANRMLREALEFFDPDGVGDAPRDAVEYVITLNNLGANELVLSQFDEALSRFKRAAAIIERTSPPLLRRGELVLSNLVVAHFMKTAIVSPIVAEIEDVIAPLSVRHSDVALLRSNLACLQAYSGNVPYGHERLRKLWSEIGDISEFSRYSIYFVGSNYAVTLAATGQKKLAQRMLRDLTATVALLPLDMQPYALRRLKILQGRLQTDGLPDLNTLDEALQTGRAEVGESWPFYGRALILTDLQFWTES
jgi:tetratricopeptide (TPR) repeat protein